MKNPRLIIIGLQVIDASVISAIRERGAKIEVAGEQPEKEKLSPFEPEPIMFHRMQFEYKPVNVEEPKRNKYFHKPRHNFKR